MRFPASLLSIHASQRIQERFKISPTEFLRILNAGLGRKIGVSARSNILHRLIWSHVDDAPLVAIQDVISGTVLTVLTIDMYRREYEPNLTDKRFQRVINQMVHAGYAPLDKWMPGDSQESVTVYAMITNSKIPISLGRWKGVVTSVDLSMLGMQDEFWYWVASQLKERGHEIEALESVTAKFSGGVSQSIPFRNS